MIQAAASKDPNFLAFAGAAVFLVAMAWLVTRRVGKTIKKDLDPQNSGRMRASMAIQADLVPPGLVKEALAKGLVTAQQMATMSPIERQFLFKTLMPKLTGGADAMAAGAPAAALLSASAPVLPLKPSTPTTPAHAPQLRSTQAMAAIPGKPMSLPPLTPEQIAALGPPPAAPPRPVPPVTPVTPTAMTAGTLGSDAFSDAEGMTLHCPCCGTRLLLPAFPPFVAFCDQCGAKTAVRTEDQGRMIINTAPPGVTRRPVR
ncbi:MAG: hypothetical protein P3A28_02060 [Gemmatimonadota bacterium]|nr:hypothetical protein [Gemmatimonadota bacterium]